MAFKDAFIDHQDGSRWEAVRIEVFPVDAKPFTSPLVLYTGKSMADADCRRLSKMMPGATVRLSFPNLCLIKAVYQNGERIQSVDARSVFDLSDEEYQLTKLRDHRGMEVF